MADALRCVLTRSTRALAAAYRRLAPRLLVGLRRASDACASAARRVDRCLRESAVRGTAARTARVLATQYLKREPPALTAARAALGGAVDRVAPDRRMLALYALLGCALGASAWMASRARHEAAELALTAGQNVDYFVQGLVSTTLDEQGRARDELRAARLVHYRDAARAALVAPRLTRHRSAAPPLRIEAEQGWADDGNTILHLTGAVRVRAQRAPGAAPIEASMTELTVYRQRDLVATQVPVRIETMGAVMEGTGMELATDTGRLVLKSAVRARYQRGPGHQP